MIRFTLVCDSEHRFESWFPSGASYDEQASRGLVECPACGSARVAKALMAPALSGTTRTGGEPPRDVEAERAPAVPAVADAVPPAMEITAPMALASERDRAMRAMLNAMREHVKANADDVGRRFADEARKMHYGEIEQRSIYGEANPLEARQLLEEGIEVHALPILPDDRN